MTPALTLTDEDSYTVQLTATTYDNNMNRDCNRNLQPLFRQFNLVGMDQAMRCTAASVRRLCQCDPIFKVQLDAVAYLQYTNYRPVDYLGTDSGSSYTVSQGSYQFCDMTNILRCAQPLLNSTRDQANFTQQAQRLLSGLGGIPCDLRPPCVDNRYNFAVTEFREMTPTSGNYRARLRLYYETFVLTEIEQRQAYNFHDVIINMGGALTFWFVAIHILVCLVSALKYCVHCCGHHGMDHHNQTNGVGRGNKVADIEQQHPSSELAGNHSKAIMHPITKSVAPVEPNGDAVEDLK